MSAAPKIMRFYIIIVVQTVQAAMEIDGKRSRQYSIIDFVFLKNATER